MTTQTTGLAIAAQYLDDGHFETEYCQPWNLIFVIEQLKKDNYRILSIDNTIYTEYHYTEDGDTEF